MARPYRAAFVLFPKDTGPRRSDWSSRGARDKKQPLGKLLIINVGFTPIYTTKAGCVHLAPASSSLAQLPCHTSPSFGSPSSFPRHQQSGMQRPDPKPPLTLYGRQKSTGRQGRALTFCSLNPTFIPVLSPVGAQPKALASDFSGGCL